MVIIGEELVIVALVLLILRLTSIIIPSKTVASITNNNSKMKENNMDGDNSALPDMNLRFDECVSSNPTAKKMK